MINDGFGRIGNVERFGYFYNRGSKTKDNGDLQSGSSMNVEVYRGENSFQLGVLCQFAEYIPNLTSTIQVATQEKAIEMRYLKKLYR